MIRLSRRQALAAGAAAAAISAPAFAAAQPPLLLDDSFEPARKARARRLFAGQPVVPLQAEIVRQWRDGLGPQVRPGAVALTRYDKALMLEGLAREAGLRTRTTRLDSATFRIDFAARPAPGSIA